MYIRYVPLPANTDCAYDPTTSPFEMPICELVVRCQVESPPSTGPLVSRDLALALRSGFWANLVRLGCRDDAGACHRDGQGVRNRQTVACSHRDSCAVPVLFRPRSTIQRRDHASPAGLMVRRCATDSFTVSIVLFGHRAVANRALIGRALEHTGTRGIRLADTSLQFLPRPSGEFSGPLHQRLAQILPMHIARDHAAPVLLELSAPLDTTSGELATVLGNMAHDFVQWDLEDRGLAERLGKAGCDQLAEAARQCASASLASVRVDDGTIATRVGTRRSRSNRNRFVLEGRKGYLHLDGDLTAAAPWLALLSLRGGGRHKSFGLGQVRLWVLGDSLGVL